IHAALDELSTASYSHDVLELALAVATSVDISLVTKSPPVWLWVVGPPGSGKTQTILPLSGSSYVEFIDSLTDAAFASGYINDHTGEPPDDLLPKLHRRCLTVKDLTTIFSLRDDKVKKFLGDLQSIYDGSYAKSTGTRGTIRYDSTFS